MENRRRRRLVKIDWNSGDSRAEKSEVRKLHSERDTKLGGARTLKLVARAPRMDVWRARETVLSMSGVSP